MQKKRLGVCADCRLLLKIWRIIRISVFFLCLFVAQSYATVTYSQEKFFTLNMHGAKVSDVLNKIEDESEFFFLFNKKLLDVERQVNVDVKNENIGKILSEIFEKTNVTYFVKDRQIILTTEAVIAESDMGQQATKVTGKVTDQTGVSVPGASVTVKGTTIGVVTDLDGKYSLTNIPENATLQFSFVGMKTVEVKVGNQTNVNVTLAEETIGIEEVVAIGYGTVKKSDLTGSVTQVKAKQFDTQQAANFLQYMTGTVAGVSVNNSTSASENAQIEVRGPTSLNANNSPLIVLDGVIFNGNLNEINPNDIESISVLKDASATAI